MPSAVHVAAHDNIAVVTTDRSHARNAVDREIAEALGGAFRAFDWDTAMRNEFRRGMEVVAGGEAVLGARRFLKGEAPDTIVKP